MGVHPLALRPGTCTPGLGVMTGPGVDAAASVTEPADAAGEGSPGRPVHCAGVGL
jgi:hypothetical protein